MSNPYFRFKQFTVFHDRCAMKVTTDACLFGAWCAEKITAVTPKRILDIGAGTGLLSLMTAQKSSALIDAVEIDGEAAAQAAENINASPWKDRINLTQADVLDWTPPHAYDCILSNPPFYQNDLRPANKQKRTAHHDETLSLPSLLRFVHQHLTETGRAFFLLPARREAEIQNALAAAGLFTNGLTRVRQSPAHAAIRLMIEAGKQPAEAVTGEIFIADEKGNYTPAFTALLKDYYLHL